MPPADVAATSRRTRLVSLLVVGMFICGCARDEGAAKIERARRDLVQIAMAIEAFKSHYGDYPEVPVDVLGEAQTFSSQRLWAALNGRRGPRAADAELSPAGPVFIQELAGLETAVVEVGYDRSRAHQYLDPWGRPHRYFYRSNLTEKRFTLYSVGPDGDAILGDPRHKALRRDGAPVNLDNVIFGEAP